MDAAAIIEVLSRTVPAAGLEPVQAADGMPVGMMLSATKGHEARLLELAYELEEARPFRGIQTADR